MGRPRARSGAHRQEGTHKDGLAVGTGAEEHPNDKEDRRVVYSRDGSREREVTVGVERKENENEKRE